MRVILAGILMLGLALAGCSGDSGDSSTTGPTGTSSTTSMDHSPMSYSISMAGNAFSNATLNIRTGDTLTWTHNDGPTTAHTVTSDSGDAFDSHPNCVAGVPVPDVCMTQGDSYSHKFERAGVFEVRCKVHSGMTMTVTVAAHNMTMMA